ncbi:MAG: YdcF family protein [Clostridia bacterium]|nr:YdcF family protein [Clostridia bacterium]
MKSHISSLRRIIGDVLIAMILLFTLQLSCLMHYRIQTVALRSTYTRVFEYELAVCGLFLLVALDIRFGWLTKAASSFLHTIGHILRILLICAVSVILFFSGKVIIGGFMDTSGTAEHAIVLGMALENGMPTSDLLARLDTAHAYLERCPEARLILTGGNPGANGKTEASVMHDLLSADGIPEHKMILEDRAETTIENFQNTAALIDPERPIVLITSNYHMDRASSAARRAGFTQIMRLPAPSSITALGTNVLWEVIMELNELTLKQ